MNNKTTIVAAVAAVVLLIVIGAVWNYRQSKDTLSVVYMVTGEVYIGELTTFPRLSLANAYQYQAVQDLKDKTKTNFELVPVAEALWSPSVMYLNKDHVVFQGPIAESSQAFKAINSKSPAAK